MNCVWCNKKYSCDMSYNKIEYHSKGFCDKIEGIKI